MKAPAQPTQLVNASVGQLWGSGTTADPLSWFMIITPGGTTLVPAGNYGFVAQAKYAAGNMTSVTVPFRISEDTVKPVVTINTPKANQHLQASAVNANTISGKVTDNINAAAVTVKLYLTVGGVKEFWNGSSFGSASVFLAADLSGSDPTNQTWKFSNLPDVSLLAPGTYSLQVGAKDAAGNSATLVSRNFIIDPPTPGALRMRSSANSF